MPNNTTAHACSSLQHGRPPCVFQIPTGLVRAHVLIVEDNTVNRSLLARILRRLGHQVACAADGEEAVQMFESRLKSITRAIDDVPYDVIFMVRRIKPEINGDGWRHAFNINISSCRSTPPECSNDHPLIFTLPFPPSCHFQDIHMPVCDGVTAARRIREMEILHNAPRTSIIALTAHTHAQAALEYTAAGMDGLISKPYDVQVLQQYISALARTGMWLEFFPPHLCMCGS